MSFIFDADLEGLNGVTLPVHCEVSPPHIGGQSSSIKLAVPAQHIVQEPPESPCTLKAKNGFFEIEMREIYWRSFPTSAKSGLSLESIELFHVGRLVVEQNFKNKSNSIRFHIAPISYLISKSGMLTFATNSDFNEIFKIKLPALGITRFVVECETIYERNAESLGATVNAGFAAVAELQDCDTMNIDTLVESFKNSLDILSILFRQAVTLHGWTYTYNGKTTSTWTNSLNPSKTPSAYEDRGHCVVPCNNFEACASQLALAYADSDKRTRSLVRHLAVAINPHVNQRVNDQFLSMFAAFERVIEQAWNQEKKNNLPTDTTAELVRRLENLKEAIIVEEGQNAFIISERLAGLIKILDRPSVLDKIKAFFRVHPAMEFYCRDLWPIAGNEKERGLREIRHAVAHGRSTYISANVIAIAQWHFAILLERLIFVLLNVQVPEGISPNTNLLQLGGRGWYERKWWIPLRSESDHSI